MFWCFCVLFLFYTIMFFYLWKLLWQAWIFFYFCKKVANLTWGCYGFQTFSYFLLFVTIIWVVVFCLFSSCQQCIHNKMNSLFYIIKIIDWLFCWHFYAFIYLYTICVVQLHFLKLFFDLFSFFKIYYCQNVHHKLSSMSNI